MGASVTKEDRVEGGNAPLDFTKKSEKPKEDTQLSKKSNSAVNDIENAKVLIEARGDADAGEEGDIDSNNYDPKTAGPIFPDGSINWDCPCLGGAAYGPCGTEFRDAFSCFHFSKEDPKGSECFPQFRGMHTCFSKYPDLYKPPKDDDDEDDDEFEEGEEREDEIQFDEEELKVINEESSVKKDKKDKQEAEEKGKSEKETEQNEPAKKSTPEAKKANKRGDGGGKVITSGAGQPAVM